MKSLKLLFTEIQSRDAFWILTVFLIASAVMMPVWIFGVPSGSDLPQHYQFAQTYYQSIRSGNFFPVWAEHENYGFGGIGIRFYPPLASYLLAVARILTGSWYDASFLTFLFWMFAGCLGIYVWAREWFSPKTAAAAALIFAVAPYHLMQIYQFFLYAEFAALAFLPFCFAYLTRVCLRRKTTDVIGLAIFYALLILTHIPTTIVGSLSLGIYALFIIDWRKFGETISRLILAAGLGLTATAFHWLKIITEISWLNHLSPQFTSGDYDFRLSFFPIYISSPDRYFAKVAYLKDLVSASSLIVLILPLIVLLFIKFRKLESGDSKYKVFRALTLVGIFAFFMSTLLSSFIWEAFSPLQKIQFPFRWLSVVSTVGTISFVIGAKYLYNLGRTFNRAAVYSILFIILTLIIFDITQIILPSAPYTRAEFEEKIDNILNEEGFECWWTVWTKRDAFGQKEKVFAGDREISVEKWSATEKSFSVDSGESAEVRLALFYYPHWKATINDQTVEAFPAENGLFAFPAPPEKSEVRLSFEEPKHIRWAFYISALAWLVIFAFLFIKSVSVFGVKRKIYSL